MQTDEKVVDLLAKMQAERDQERLWITRGQLRALMLRVHIAEGMSAERAKIYADHDAAWYGQHLHTYMAALKNIKDDLLRYAKVSGG